jgi:hypothetical protein
MPGSSFFTWFDQERRAVPTMDDVDDIAAALKDDIWPNPLKYYTGDMQVPPPVAGARREARQAQHAGFVAAARSADALGGVCMLGCALVYPQTARAAEA